MVMNVTVYFSLLYVKSRNLEQDQVQPRLWFIFLLVMIPSNFFLPAVVAENFDAPVVRKEMSDLMYGVIPYLASTLCIRLPFVLLFAVCSLFPGAFGIAGFSFRAFARCVLTQLGYFCVCEGIALACGRMENLIVGCIQYLNNVFTLLFFAGFFFRPSDVSWVFRWVIYASPMGYVVRVLIVTVFQKSDPYGGTLPCANCTKSFYCPNVSTCWGRTGFEIVESLSTWFPEVNNGVDIQFGISYLFASGSAFYLCYVVAVWQSGRPPTVSYARE